MNAQLEKMDPALKVRWVKALSSGRYKQGKNFLRKDNEFCCLGVLCTVKRVSKKVTRVLDTDFYTFGSGTSLLPSPEDVQLSRGLMQTLASMNDTGYSFPRIADWIEENL